MANGIFGGGDGTVNNPYLVEDIKDLLALNNVSIGSSKKHYLQTADIDLSEYSETNFPTLRIVTPSYSVGNSYGFVYDGGGHKILNLTQLLDGSATADFGLFELYTTLSSATSVIRENAVVISLKNINLINVNLSGTSGSPFLKPQNFNFISTSSGHSFITDIKFENCFVSGKMSNLANMSTSTSCFVPGKMYRYSASHNCVIYPTIIGCVAVMQINLQSNGVDSATPSFGGFIGETQYSTNGSYYAKIQEPTVVNSCLHLDIHVENVGLATLKVAGMVAGSSTRLTTSYANISYDVINSGDGTTNCYYFTPSPSQTGSCIANHEKGMLDQYAYDNLHYLTDEQMKDSSYYERLGWWI